MLLSSNIFINDTVLHTSLVPITISTFPLNYSIKLTDRDYQFENVTSFSIVSMIWQPAYIFDDNIELSKSQVNTLNLNMRSISKRIYFSSLIFLVFRICYYSW